MEFTAESIRLTGLRIFGGPLEIRYYGIIIVLAMLVAAWVAARLARRTGRNPEHIWGALTWAIIPAIIGARLFYILFPPQPDIVSLGHDTAWYLSNFFNLQEGAIAIWSGGLNIFGAVIGGLIGGLLYLGPWHNRVARVFTAISRFWRFYLLIIGAALIAVFLTNQNSNVLVVGIIIIVLTLVTFIPRVRRWLVAANGPIEEFPDEGLPILPWLDIAFVALPLGQAIGRWANFINQELYGTPTTLPWGIVIPSDKRLEPFTSPVDFPPSTLFHPLFLYESLWSILAFIVLLRLYQRNRDRFLPGDFVLMYLMQYAVIRFLLEGIRVSVSYLPGTTINLWQAVSALIFVLSLVILLYRHRAGTVGKPAEQQTA
jgi:prolipoprotein diacylglyceryl transferase